MLDRLKQLRGYGVSAIDGDLGRVDDFLFDDERWTIRHLVVGTGGFLRRARVLISPISFERLEWARERFRLSLTKDQVENSPSVDSDRPVSRQHELDLSHYYGYGCYWPGSLGAPEPWGAGLYPAMLAPTVITDAHRDALREAQRVTAEQSRDVHLRSARQVSGYHIQGKYESIGHIEDFLVDDTNWQIRYIVIDTRNWWFGKKVLLQPDWLRQISWENRQVKIDLTRQALRTAPAWEPSTRLDEVYDQQLRQHYGHSMAEEAS